MFREYPEIENTYQEKSIAYFLEHNPSAIKTKWIIEEKINGTNMQLNIEPSGEHEVGSRNRIIPPNEDQYSFKVFLKTKFDRILEILVDFAKKQHVSLRVYGEFFGPKVVAGIDYGDERRFVAFGMMVDNTYLTQEQFRETFISLGLNDYLIHKLAIVDSFKEALEYNQIFESFYSPSKDVAEGIVIKPYNINYLATHTGNLEDAKPIYFKKKHPDFLDKQKKPKGKKVAESAQGYLLEYLTPARITSCFSKEGPIKDKTEIQKYIKLITQDILKDYDKDSDSKPIEKKEIAELSRAIVPYLLKEL